MAIARTGACSAPRRICEPLPRMATPTILVAVVVYCRENSATKLPVSDIATPSIVNTILLVMSVTRSIPLSEPPAEAALKQLEPGQGNPARITASQLLAGVIMN